MVLIFSLEFSLIHSFKEGFSRVIKTVIENLALLSLLYAMVGTLGK